MNDVIAERKLYFATKDGGRKNELIIRIGLPYYDDKGMAKCPVEWDGLFEDFADIYGIDTLHALHLASDIDSLLGKLGEKYDFYWLSGEPYFDEVESVGSEQDKG